MSVTPHCTQKKTQNFFLCEALLCTRNVVPVNSKNAEQRRVLRPCRCSLRRRVLARAGRRLAVRTGKHNYVGGGGGMVGSAARDGAGGVGRQPVSF